MVQKTKSGRYKNQCAKSFDTLILQKVSGAKVTQILISNTNVICFEIASEFRVLSYCILKIFGITVQKNNLLRSFL